MTYNIHFPSVSQSLETPWDFFEAVERKFGRMRFDLAASKDNTKCLRYYDKQDDSLNQNWIDLEGNLWLNPPFRRARYFAKKSKLSTSINGGRLVFFLSIAGVSRSWYQLHVYRHALIYAIRPTPIFIGHSNPFPQDMTLAIYGKKPGFKCWNWKKMVERELPFHRRVETLEFGT
jgi:phage N-6-adenine-methyltransferase